MKNYKIVILLLTIIVSCKPVPKSTYNELNDELYADPVPKSTYNELNDGLYVDMQTSKGNILLELYPEDTPLTVANFVGLAEGTHPKVGDKFSGKNFYDGLRFYRVVPNFIIQAGDDVESGSGGSKYLFADEFPKDSTGGFKYKHDAAGILSMANPGLPNTNGSQFFITHKPTPWLNGKHSIFGYVVQGLDVVHAIKQSDTIFAVKILRVGEKAENFDASKTFLAAEVTVANAQKEQLAATKKAEQVRYNQFLEAKTANYTKLGADKVRATASGLKVLKLKSTRGKKVVDNQPITINFTLFLGDGKRLQSTLDAGKKPFTFQLDNKERPLITGFKEGLKKLREGEKARLFIPYYIAYGEKGGGIFPPKADIIFEVEILKVGK